MAVQPGAMERRANQFDVARKRAAEQETANLQASKEGLNRRLAQSGGGPGGVAIKLDEQANDASSRRLAAANEGIAAQESADLERKAETLAGRQFAREERIGSQGYQSGENALSRRFATSERLGGQEFSRGEREGSQTFASGEAGKQREFATGERLGAQEFANWQADKDKDFQWKQADIAREQDTWKTNIQASQFVQQMDMAWKQFEQQQYVDRFNMDLAKAMFEEKDFLEKLMTGNPLSAEGNPALGQWMGVFSDFGIGG